MKENKTDMKNSETLEDTVQREGESENKMGIMPIKKLLFTMAWPAILSMTISALYNIVDSIFVAKLSEDALTAVSIVNPIQMLIIALSVGSGVGINSLISRKLGAKRQQEADQAASTGLRIGVFNYLIFLIIGVFFTGIFVSGYAEKGTNIYDGAVTYMSIICIGSFFLNMQVVFEKILQSTGNMIGPMTGSLTGAIVNIILDFTFVCGFHMGIAGVAIATIMAQAVSSFMVMHKLMHTREDYKVEIRKIRFHKKMIRKIIAFGFPAACQQSITSFSNVVVQSYINRFGTAAMAGYSATLRIDGFLQLPLQSFNMAITTFVGQNIGARKYKRVKKGIFAAWVMSSLIILAGSVGMYFGAPLLISVFTNDPQVIGNGSSMLRIFSRAYIVMPVIQVLNGALRGAGLSKVPMFFMLGSFVVLRQIYLLVAVPMTHSLMVVMAGWPITWVICAAGMFLYYVKADWLPKEAGPEGE